MNDPRPRLAARCTLGAFAAMMVMMTAIPAYAQGDVEWEETLIYAPIDIGGDGAFVSRSLAVTEEFIFAGGPGVDASTGAVFLFGRRSGEQIGRLTGSDSAIGDNFGHSLVVDDRFIVVAAPFHKALSQESGAVYVFDAASRAELRKIVIEDADARFGWDVSFAGPDLIVGSPDQLGSGRVHVIDPDSGTTRGVLSADFGFLFLGTATAGSEQFIAAGAPNIGQRDGGRVYIFDRATLEPAGAFGAADPGTGDDFGGSLAMGRNNLLAVSTGASPSPNLREVTILDLNTRARVARIAAPDDSDGFGREVLFGDSIGSDVIFVGANEAIVGNQRTGAVYAFDPRTGVQLSTIAPESRGGDERIGESLAFYDDRLFAGAPRRTGAFFASGAVYRLERSDKLHTIPPVLTSFEDSSFVVVGARPEERTWMLYSFDGISSGGTFLRRLNVVVSLEDPQLAWGPLRTDIDGDIAVPTLPPGVVEPLDVWFQLVQDSFVSNWISTQILPQ